MEPNPHQIQRQRKSANTMTHNPEQISMLCTVNEKDMNAEKSDQRKLYGCSASLLTMIVLGSICRRFLHPNERGVLGTLI